ncbi:hypothetical protein ABER99_20355 [Paenibacillus glucanolyticus]|jgi:hypothetical protein|uniref:Uncharacterized protein n=1 Tax=Paenibacillus glucanolyticus TaxID=59843 RepID=A0A163GIU3_9BACL|nr:hypothetical protein [Paenibacillus glucanolyticus]KZS44995.1 hypothetical protein AWU65_03165 [Paenibacillus glucanolyticus]OMF64149.1 hypothetical protein BK142_32165 [Paenibacillus glucanolyticus]
MDFPVITISAHATRNTLTELINEFIRIEKSTTGLEYQQRSNFVRGQIAVITSLINDIWDRKHQQSYYAYLNYLVQKYSLQGVWRIVELGN